MDTKKLYSLLLMLFLIFMSACSPGVIENPDEPAHKEPDTGMANPASFYCEEHGGHVEIRTDPQSNQYGVCIFDDGTECEEWAYMRGECQVGQFEKAPIPGEEAPEENQPEVGMPNPASAYCEEQGGALEIRTDSSGGQIGICVFEDGSECEEWAFINGECQPGDHPKALLEEYLNLEYGFSIKYPGDWEIEDEPNRLVLRQVAYYLFIGYRNSDEDVGPFRTGMPAGEFMEGGSVPFMGREINKRYLVLDDKIKVVEYGAGVEASDLRLYIWLDSTGAADYTSLDIPEEVIAAADAIVSSFTIVGGE